MGQVIVITSGKGGVGKTTTSANIGTALASLGNKVVVVDGDTGLRNLDVLMGLENRVIYTLVDAIEGKCRLNQAMIKDKRLKDLYLLPTAQTRDKNDIKSEDMLALVEKLREEFDYILIDCPAGIEQGFENAVIGADWAIVVVNPEITSVRDADRVIGKLDAKGISRHELIVNRINPAMSKKGEMLGVNDIIDCLAIKLIGVVPDDKSVTVSTNKGEPVVLESSSTAGKAFSNIAKRICGEEVPFIDMDNINEGFFDKIKRIFSGNKQ